MTDLYKSPEWKSLDEIDRAQLLLVIEGLKNGTIIGGNWTTFIDILDKTGLGYELNTNKYRLNPVMMVAKPEVLSEANHRYLSLPKNTTSADYFRISGWSLGYPECCIEEYSKERTPEQDVARKMKIHHLTYKFGQELDQLIKSGKSYPEYLDYRPPSFTPCGVYCREAEKVLTSWKDALDTLDPEAGKELSDFNRRSYPERLVHREYLQQEAQRMNLEYKIEFLRKSCE